MLMLEWTNAHSKVQFASFKAHPKRLLSSRRQKAGQIVLVRFGTRNTTKELPKDDDNPANRLCSTCERRHTSSTTTQDWNLYGKMW